MKDGIVGELFKYYEGTLGDFLHEAINEKGQLIKIIIKDVDQLKFSQIDGKGCILTSEYHHVIDNYAIRHIISKHSSEKESLRGQVQIQITDFLLIPNLLTEYDAVRTEIRNKKEVLIYEKTYSDITYNIVEEVRKGRKELAVVTFYKTRKGKLTGADS